MRIAIAAGGTGGHLYPGIALARALVNQEVIFLVRRGDLGKAILEKEGFSVREVAGQGLPRDLSLKVLIFPFKFVLGTIETIAFLLFKRPDHVVGMGGYISFPAIVFSRLFFIKSLIHEQNVVPGLANRLLSRVADSVAVSFEESLSYFPKGKAWVSGIPVRPEMGQTDRTTGRRYFDLELERTTYLVFGGSLGAHKLNTLVTQAWAELLKKGIKFQVLHITGANDHVRVQKLYDGFSFPAKVLPYCHAMPSAYAAADVVICRAGASTIAELMLSKRRALLVPYPFATHDHQTYNAKVLEKAGLADLIQEKDLTPSRIAEVLLATRAHGPSSITPEKISGAASRLASYLTRPAD